MAGPIPAPERVLPTLNADGSRRRIRPKLYAGRYHRRRLLTAWALIALFVALPLLRMGGKPLILLDVAAREFTFFGRTFFATDGVLLMLLMLSIFLTVIWLTALVGRAWCGWACPQTVYMEYVFRPIERLIEGDRTAQLKLDEHGPNGRRVAKWIVFAVLSVVVGNVFLSYFVGVDRLARWVTQNPAEHPAAFGVMAVTAGLVFFDFAYFREQMCTVVCPYARLQSVLLDKRSLIVGYDALRGEPRSHGKPTKTSGDCIDCNACVVSCPTGIDIREGLQLECIACTQCADACDAIMLRIGKPPGLVGYGSQERFETGRAHGLLRPRVLAYPLLIVVAIGALVMLGGSQPSADVTVLRGIGAPWVVQGDHVQNQLRIKVENRGAEARDYAIELSGVDDGRLIAPENPLHVAAGRHETTTIFVLAPTASFTDGKRAIGIRVHDGHDYDRTAPYQLLGPWRAQAEKRQ